VAFIVIVLSILFISLFFFSISVRHLNLHSFPTRRSSDLPLNYLLVSFVRSFSNLVRQGKFDIVHSHLAGMSGAVSFAAFLGGSRSEEHTSELQSLRHLVCRLLLEKKKLN